MLPSQYLVVQITEVWCYKLLMLKPLVLTNTAKTILINLQNPSGEVAFKSLHLELGYAKSPLIDRISDLHKDIPVTMIYGAQSWMDPTNGYRVQVTLKF